MKTAVTKKVGGLVVASALMVGLTAGPVMAVTGGNSSKTWQTKKGSRIHGYT